MKKFSFITSFLMYCAFSVLAQTSGGEARFLVESSTTEVKAGLPFRLTFTMENIQNARFSPPDWAEHGIEFLGSPSQSSNMRMVNGVVSSKVTQTYHVRATKEGKVTLPAVTMEANGKKYHTNPLILTILPNPDGVEEWPAVPSPTKPSPTKVAPKRPRETVRL